MRTQEEINAAIEHFEKIKPTIRKRDFFGGDNHEKIDAQIYTLKHPDMKNAYDILEALEYDTDDESLEDAIEIQSAIQVTIEWIEGKEDSVNPFLLQWDNLVMK